MNKLLQWILVTISISILIATTKISFLSLPDKHPDEKYHIIASKYYLNHWVPPKYDDPIIKDSYSKEGFSRLNDIGVSYFLSGKLASIVSAFLDTKNEVWMHRLFYLLLLSIILTRINICSFTNNKIGLIYLPLLIFSQPWYVFSYVNDDALPLFISFILFDLLLTFKDKQLPSKYAIGIGLALGVLSISKINYMLFDIYIIGWIIIHKAQKHFSKKIFLYIFIPFLSFIGLRQVLDTSINGFNKVDKIMEYTVTMSRADYSNLSNPNIRMQNKGVSAHDVIFKYGWLRSSIESLIGVYGKMNLYYFSEFYKTMITLIIFLLFYSIFLVLKSNNYITIAMCGAMVGSILFLSFLVSWLFDFQPQGRYLFPLLPIIGFTIYYYRDTLKPNLLSYLTISITLILVIGYLNMSFGKPSSYFEIKFYDRNNLKPSFINGTEEINDTEAASEYRQEILLKNLSTHDVTLFMIDCPTSVSNINICLTNSKMRTWTLTTNQKSLNSFESTLYNEDLEKGEYDIKVFLKENSGEVYYYICTEKIIIQ